MGKNKRRQFEQFDEFHNNLILCDSQEECDFINWCSEMAIKKLIIDYEYQPKPFILFDAAQYININNKTRSLLKKHEYSPDFILTFNPQTSKILLEAFKIPLDKITNKSIDVYLDVKGTFQRNGTGRAFSINQKWVYQKFSIYVQKLVPVDFFKICGCPLKCFNSIKTNRPRSMFKGYPSIDDIFN